MGASNVLAMTWELKMPRELIFIFFDWFSRVPLEISGTMVAREDGAGPILRILFP